jgi:toxin CcdB
MAQYDVYLNPNPAYRQSFPYVVDVQHASLELAHTRMTIPLARFNRTKGGALPYGVPKRLNPGIDFEGEQLILMPHLAAPLNMGFLKNPIGSVRGFATEIQAGLDAVLSGV